MQRARARGGTEEGRERREGGRRGERQRDLSTPKVVVTCAITLSACKISSRTESSTAVYPPAGVVGVGGSDADAPVTSVLSSSALLPLSPPPPLPIPRPLAAALPPPAPPALAAAASAAGSCFSHERMRFSGERVLISASASVLIPGGFLPLRLPLGVPATFPPPPALACTPCSPCRCRGAARFSLPAVWASLCAGAAAPAPSRPPSRDAMLEPTL